MKLSYTRCGDYYFPNLSLADETNSPLGKYGRMRQTYLKEHRPILYSSLILSGKLWPHLTEIDKTCNERMALLVPAMAKQEGVTETLKAEDQMRWVGCMNNIHHRAEEIILTELVYE